MDIENPIALHFIMQDDLFFLEGDKETYAFSSLQLAGGEGATITQAAEKPIVAEVAAMKFSYKGKKGDMLILVYYPELEFIHDAHLTALESILKRKEVALDDVAIVNMAKHTGAGFESLVNYFAAKKILLLGKQALPVGMAQLSLNTPQQLDSGMALYSFSFDEMMDSPDNKKAFWEQMKNF